MKIFGWFVVTLMMLFTLTACYGGPPAPQIPALMSPAGMTNTSAAAKNNEGVGHLVQGHYGISETFFRDYFLENQPAPFSFLFGLSVNAVRKKEM